MILICPSCESKFRVKDDAIGPNGRKVKCRNCAHTWHAMPDGAEDTAPPPPPPPPKPKPAPAPEPAPQAEAGDPFAFDDEPEDPPPPPPPPDPTAAAIDGPPMADPPPVPPEGEFVLRQRTPKVEKKSPLMAWVILLVILIATAAVGFFFQKDIVTAYPPITKVYNWVGLHPDILGHGLERTNVQAKLVEGDGDNRSLVLTGEIHTDLSERTDIPMLRGALVDTAGNELFVWYFKADKLDILPGEVVTFTTDVTNPPPGAVEAKFEFSAEDEKSIGEDAMMKETDGHTEPMHQDDGHGDTSHGDKTHGADAAHGETSSH